MIMAYLAISNIWSIKFNLQELEQNFYMQHKHQNETRLLTSFLLIENTKLYLQVKLGILLKLLRQIIVMMYCLSRPYYL